MSLLTFISIAFCTFIMAVVIVGVEVYLTDKKEREIWKAWWKDVNANADKANRRTK